jgi:hypothetical protein
LLKHWLIFNIQHSSSPKVKVIHCHMNICCLKYGWHIQNLVFLNACDREVKWNMGNN